MIIGFRILARLGPGFVGILGEKIAHIGIQRVFPFLFRVGSQGFFFLGGELIQLLLFDLILPDLFLNHVFDGRFIFGERFHIAVAVQIAQIFVHLRKQDFLAVEGEQHGILRRFGGEIRRLGGLIGGGGGVALLGEGARRQQHAHCKNQGQHPEQFFHLDDPLFSPHSRGTGARLCAAKRPPQG